MKLRNKPVVFGVLSLFVLFFGASVFFNYFYEGDIRSKVSGVRRNLRQCAMEIQQELELNHRLPPGLEPAPRPQPLPEKISKLIVPYGRNKFQGLPEYYRFAQPSAKGWLLINTGPNSKFELDATALAQLSGVSGSAEIKSRIQGYLYDPSNGTRSAGDLVQVSE